MNVTEPPMKPADTTNFLLGGMNAKLDTVLSNQVGYEDRLRKVEEIVSALPKRTPWPSVAAGIGSIAAIAVAAIALLRALNP